MQNEELMYECLGGPLCGRLEPPMESEIGVPCFAWEGEDGTTYYYRLARSKGRRYWHFLGSRKIDLWVKPFLRPSP